MERKEFLQLQKTWYSKLEKKGFQDIETLDTKTGEMYLERTEKSKVYDLYTGNNRPNSRPAKDNEEYYRFAGHFLHDHTFDNTLEKAIWDLHTQGKSIRETLDILKKKTKFKVYKSKIQDIIQRLVKEFKETYFKTR